MRREEIPQCGLVQLAGETLFRARARDRLGPRKRGHRVVDARHGGELRLVQFVLARVDAGAEILRQATAEARVRILSQRGIERLVAHPHEARDELRRLVDQAVLGEQHGLGLDGDDFAVDEHAVAIEDDGADQLMNSSATDENCRTAASSTAACQIALWYGMRSTT